MLVNLGLAVASQNLKVRWSINGRLSCSPSPGEETYDVACLINVDCTEYFEPRGTEVAACQATAYQLLCEVKSSCQITSLLNLAAPR